MGEVAPSRHRRAPDVTVTAASLGGVPTAEITVDGIEPRHVVLYFHASLACGHGESPPRPSEPPNEAAGVLAAACGRPIAATNSAMDGHKPTPSSERSSNV
jgi:hypothetical protein